MDVNEILGTARDTITVKRVYGEPYEKDGLTVIPAATVGGGGGGGSAHDQHGQDNAGGGFGLSGRPVGAFVIKDGQVSWRPAVDPNRIVATLGAVAVVYLVSRARLVRARARLARRTSER